MLLKLPLTSARECRSSMRAADKCVGVVVATRCGGGAHESKKSKDRAPHRVEHPHMKCDIMICLACLGR